MPRRKIVEAALYLLIGLAYIAMALLHRPEPSESSLPTTPPVDHQDVETSPAPPLGPRTTA